MSQVDEYITALTGISPAMLETAPSAEKVFPAVELTQLNTQFGEPTVAFAAGRMESVLHSPV
mgnify:CR=1 FL=1